MKITNEEVQELIARADAEYDMLKDKVHEQYDEIQRLNNIIDNLDMMLKTLIMESEFSEHKLTAQIILMNLNELRGFNKGVDKQ